MYIYYTHIIIYNYIIYHIYIIISYLIYHIYICHIYHICGALIYILPTVSARKCVDQHLLRKNDRTHTTASSDTLAQQPLPVFWVKINTSTITINSHFTIVGSCSCFKISSNYYGFSEKKQWKYSNKKKNINWLVVLTILKNISQWGGFSHLL